MSNKRTEKLRAMRTALCLVLVGLYFIGIIAMITFSFQLGLILWVVSTLGGIGLLYWVRTMEKRAEDAAKAEAKAVENADENEAGADDEACE